MSIATMARAMKLECYQHGISQRTLARGLMLTLTPYKSGWKLIMERENISPSKQEYKIIARAFFDKRVKNISQPSENAFALSTV